MWPLGSVLCRGQLTPGHGPPHCSVLIPPPHARRLLGDGVFISMSYGETKVQTAAHSVHYHLPRGSSSGSLPIQALYLHKKNKKNLEERCSSIFLVVFHFFANKVICFTTHFNVFDICHKTQVRQICLLLK